MAQINMLIWPNAPYKYIEKNKNTKNIRVLKTSYLQ